MTNAIYLVCCLIEKYQERHKDLHMVFIDLVKAYDSVPRAVIWHCLEVKRVLCVYIRII